MFERIVMKIMSVTYIQYVPANLKKNHTVTENNLETEEHRKFWNNNFEQY